MGVQITPAGSGVIALTEIIGYVAGTLTTVAVVPEIVELYKTKAADEISYSWLLVAGTGVLIWFAYGVMIYSIPLIISNAVTASLYTILLALKVHYTRRMKKSRRNR